jgi:hypothetical protein
LSTQSTINRVEVELLLCCARTSKTPETAARIGALLQENIDWKYLLWAAHRHTIVPLLYWHLDETCPEAVPESTLDHLRDHFRTTNLRNLVLTGELLKILNTFKARGISAVPYKGPALAASIYGNIALRQFDDLDIIVHRYDVPKAENLLTSLGYRPRYQLTSTQRAAFLRSQCEHLFTRDDGRSVVELHWEITERHLSFPLDIERLWERLEQIPLGGYIIPTLSPEDMLLVLCAHGAKHLWERLGWICDVAELIRVHQNMRWEQVMAQAGALGGERMLLLGLFLANELLGAALPKDVLQRVRVDPTVKGLAGRIYEQLFREDDGPSGLLEESYFQPLYLKMRERWPDKIRYCVRKATTPTVEDWELLPLPRVLFPFYHVLRPIRLVGNYGLRTLKRLL